MAHPLTDDIISENFTPDYYYVDWDHGEVCVGFNNDDMRAAADWQLERDTEYFYSYLVTVLGWDPVIAQARMETFKKTMRPQEDN